MRTSIPFAAASSSTEAFFIAATDLKCAKRAFLRAAPTPGTDKSSDFIDFAESFGELVSAGHIIETKDGETAYYTVSPTGKTVAGSLQDQILQPIRERAFRSALRILSFKKRNAEIFCTLKEKDGGYLVECSISENGITLMSASVLCDSRIRAERMKENFIERPEAIYKGLSALLASEVNYLFT